MTDQDGEQYRAFLRKHQAHNRAHQRTVSRQDLAISTCELGTLAELIDAWQKQGLDPSESDDQWVRIFRAHADLELTRVTAILTTLRLDWLATNTPGDFSTSSIIGQLCSEIWYQATTLRGAKHAKAVAGDALPPHPERLPLFWATPIAMREWIRQGFDIEVKRLTDWVDPLG
jgi:hypothetical protein